MQNEMVSIFQLAQNHRWPAPKNRFIAFFKMVSTSMIDQF